ncbi:DUF4190 domain-containing protein [Actinomyces sp. ZJ308]|uniref:DUF4190 domain-containing protein n=1 Tax=Actinomyces sp. ZJ308 TaxID=2708342 RepID=UPI001422F240|nr:DUF4190 domain-containing protein [Actinomyces sp. ZJ308]
MSNMGAYPNGPYNQQPGGYGGGFGPRPDEKNSLGGWALGLGIASLICCSVITGIPAMIVGYLGMQAANEGRATNKGMSIAGIVMGGLSILWLIIAFATGQITEAINSFQSV